ncbi:MAG: DUF2800 domain-containing protein [Clostridia bacterium]|jgi:hypothetical protein
MGNKSEHHPTFSPSKLDILVVCPFFQSAPAGEAAEMGTRHHAYAESLLRLPPGTATPDLPADEKEAVEWYVDYVRATASGELAVEQKLELQDDNLWVVTFGTLDAAAGTDIFDYKSDREERPHTYQMAAYALMWMRAKSMPTVTAHICYGRLRKVVKLSFTEQEAADMVELVQAIYYNPERKHTPSEYCGWCANATTCPVLSRCTEIVVKNTAPDENITPWNPAEVTDPAVVGRMLNMARIVAAWSDAVEKHARLMMAAGQLIPGWSVLERAGARQIKDIVKAFQLTGLPESAFLQTCKVGVGELEAIFAKEKGLKKAEAKRQLNDLLADVIERKKPSLILTKEK